MTLEAGSRLGGYEILGHIGAGGMGACGSWRGGGAPRHFSKKTDFAHSEVRRWR
jgi:hypothetical protein